MPDEAMQSVGGYVFYLDGKRMLNHEAFEHLLDCGFSKSEANSYLNLLYREAAIQRTQAQKNESWWNMEED